jgi:hypothetical protein
MLRAKYKKDRVFILNAFVVALAARSALSQPAAKPSIFRGLSDLYCLTPVSPVMGLTKVPEWRTFVSTPKKEHSLKETAAKWWFPETLMRVCCTSESQRRIPAAECRLNILTRH